MSRIVQSLWIGSTLSEINLLSISSFIKNNVKFVLYTYSKIDNVPQGVYVRDANEILSKDYIFHVHNSYAIFSDFFRCVMLKKVGGLWVDLDVVMINDFDFDSDFLAGFQCKNYVCNAVLKLDGKPALLDELCHRSFYPWLYAEDTVIKSITEEYDCTIDALILNKGDFFLRELVYSCSNWGEISGPYGITSVFNKFNVLNEVKSPDIFYPVPYENWWSVFYDTSDLLKDKVFKSMFIHLWSNCISEYLYFKDYQMVSNSVYFHLVKKYL